MSAFTLKLIDNSAVQGIEDRYALLTFDLNKAIESWKSSLFSFEWLTSEGDIRDFEALGEKQREQYQTVSALIQSNDSLERPIIGVGIMDNIEIGSRRDVLLTAFASGVRTMEVHVLKTHLDELRPYQAKGL